MRKKTPLGCPNGRTCGCKWHKYYEKKRAELKADLNMKEQIKELDAEV